MAPYEVVIKGLLAKIVSPVDLKANFESPHIVDVMNNFLS